MDPKFLISQKDSQTSLTTKRNLMPRCVLSPESHLSTKTDGSFGTAQLWMGTHPSCPSTLIDNGKDLKQYLKDHPELLGKKVVDKFGDDLPFLFKVRRDSHVSAL